MGYIISVGREENSSAIKSLLLYLEKVMTFIKNSDVINAWKNGQDAQGVSLHTDGNNLYSERLLIGYSGGSARTTKRVINYKTVSGAATRAVNLAQSMGVKSVNPKGIK